MSTATTDRLEEGSDEALEAIGKQLPKEPQFLTRWHNRKPRFWFLKDRGRRAGFRDEMEVVRLGVAPGVSPSPKPPVRIYLGTEPGQFRPERVFVWSVMQVRDPARVYEIYLMTDIAGFDRRGWKTGFTNYRYAIPVFAGGQGRAIYNDVDQVYLGDPAELFDLDMGGAGVMAVNERDTSVMLIDCAKMVEVWDIEHARNRMKHRGFRGRMLASGAWGRLPGTWNARDGEYVPGLSKCFHFTTLQTQPWRPFPDQIVYQPHPHYEVWASLERTADAARFNAFTGDRPSARYVTMRDEVVRGHNQSVAAQVLRGDDVSRLDAPVRKLAERTGSKTVLRLGPHDGFVPLSLPAGERFDGVVAIGTLERLPEEDMGWALDAFFAAAKGFVYVTAPAYPIGELPAGEPPGPLARQPAKWWHDQLLRASARNPGVRWELGVIDHAGFAPRKRRYSGGDALATAA